MKGVNYKHANTKLLGGRPNVYDLPICKFEYKDGQKAVESCWKMSFKERTKALFTGKVYFTCWGHTHPPMLINVSSVMDKDYAFFSKKN